MTKKNSPLKQRESFAKFAKQLASGNPPTAEQTEWLIVAFSALSDPENNTDQVLGLKYGSGKSREKEIAARKMDALMHWIAGAISSDTSHLIDPADAIPPMTLEDAFHQASAIAKTLFKGDKNAESYDYYYIRKCWYDKEKKYRQDLYRNVESLDVFYEFPIE